MFFRCMGVQIRKILCNYGFFVGIAFTVVLCLFSEAYVDVLKDVHYSIIALIFHPDRMDLTSTTELCAEYVIRRAASGWITLFVPIIAAFVSVPGICDVRQSKMLRMEIVRTNRNTYNIATALAAVLMGGVAVVLGFLIFFGIVQCFFPSIHTYPAELQEDVYWGSILLGSRTVFQDLAELSLWYFLYGMVWTVPSLFLASFMSNKYLILCIPFMTKYALERLCMSLEGLSMANPQAMNYKLLLTARTFHPDAILRLQDHSNSVFVLLIHFAISILLVYECIAINMWRLDCGE